MSGREGSPAIVEQMVCCFRADVNGDEGIGLCVSAGLATRDEIRSRSTDGILNDIGDEEGHDQSNGEAKVRCLMLVARGARDEVVQDQASEGYEERVDKVHACASQRQLIDSMDAY